jgi:hypothetical protein
VWEGERARGESERLRVWKEEEKQGKENEKNKKKTPPPCCFIVSD